MYNKDTTPFKVLLIPHFFRLNWKSRIIYQMNFSGEFYKSDSPFCIHSLWVRKNKVMFILFSWSWSWLMKISGNSTQLYDKTEITPQDNSPVVFVSFQPDYVILNLPHAEKKIKNETCWVEKVRTSSVENAVAKFIKLKLITVFYTVYLSICWNWT